MGSTMWDPECGSPEKCQPQQSLSLQDQSETHSKKCHEVPDEKDQYILHRKAKLQLVVRSEARSPTYRGLGTTEGEHWCNS